MSTNTIMDQLSLDKELLLDSKFMKRIIKNPAENAIYKASYRYPSKVVDLSKPMSVDYYLHYFRKRIKSKTEACKEWDITLIGNNLLIGQLKGVSKIGNKRHVKVGKETRPNDSVFLAVFWINIILTFFASIYSLLSLVSSFRLSLYHQMIYFFQPDIGFFTLWFAVASGISSLGLLSYKLHWNRDNFFFRKRKTWKVIGSILVFDNFSLSIAGTIYFSEELFVYGITWYYDILSYLIAIIYFVGLLALIFALMRSYHKKEPDLIARNLSTVWIRYQFLIVPDDGNEFSKLSMNRILEYKPKKLLTQVLICWDFKTISQAFADVEQAKNELAKLIKEVEIVFGGNYSM
ncbi:MAG: hypothetical protein KGD64_12690 [Candidatus Heimdallarchaeota archaeon]|nr:hypothetical protein [Candidatus Heimdallarchaeota archaeon]